MSNATDRLDEAEGMIKDVMVGNIPTQKALEICRWLLSFNGKEEFSIKCYKTGKSGKREDIRFCIDRGSDCLSARIRTNFIVIEPNFEIMGLYSRNPEAFPYLRMDNNRWRINTGDIKKLDIERIKGHILEL